jgi:hypothetical protein
MIKLMIRVSKNSNEYDDSYHDLTLGFFSLFLAASIDLGDNYRYLWILTETRGYFKVPKDI